MTGIIGGASGYHAILNCDVLLQLGADFAWPQFYPDRRKSFRSTSIRRISAGVIPSRSASSATSGRRCRLCCRDWSSMTTPAF
jgi:hypothetical protein